MISTTAIGSIADMQDMAASGLSPRVARHSTQFVGRLPCGTHAGYVAAVTAAADNALAQGYLLQADHDALIAAAQASNVLQ